MHTSYLHMERARAPSAFDRADAVGIGAGGNSGIG